MMDSEMLVELLRQVVMPIAMFTMMFAMGLTLTLKDFGNLLIFPKIMLLGLFIQLMILPAIGIFLAMSFPLNTMIAVGLVALAASPGGTLSNFVTHLGKGNTALSILLTVIATMLALITLPLWINLALTYFNEPGTFVKIPVLKTAFDLGLFTVLPLWIGLFAVKKYPKLESKERYLSRGAALIILLVFIAVTVIDKAETLTNPGVIILPCLMLLFSAAVLGYFIPRFLGVNTKDSATISVELCMKNVVLVVFVAMHSLKDLEAAYAGTVYMAGMVPMGIAIMIIYNFFEKRTQAKESIKG